MRNIIKIAGTLLTLAALTTSSVAAPVCTPLPPKKLEGTIMVVPPARHSITASQFLDNGCDWAGMEQLNGFDAHVFDMTGIEGPTTITVIAGPVGLALPYEHTTLDANCAPIGEVITTGSSGVDFPQPHKAEIPAGTKWMVSTGDTVLPVNGNFATQVTVYVDFEGKVCPPVKKKKKKS